MRKFLVFLLLSAAALIQAQTGAIQNHCYLGGQKAVTNSLQSTNYFDGTIPSCTVTVYLTGTTTPATIYKDASRTPLANPFTANTAASVDPGGWIFWAATNAGLDVMMSGGIAPNTYPQPVTLVDIFPSSSFNPVNGCLGTISGDNTSTDCGFGNQASNTGTSISTFGYTNVLNNAHNDITAVGTNNINQNFGSEVFAGGGRNFTDVLNSNHVNDAGLIGIGWSNGVYNDSVAESAAGDLTYVGSNNGKNLTGTHPSEVVGIGQGNASNLSNGSSEIVGIGDSNLANTAASNNFLFGAVGIGDNTCAWAIGTQPTGQFGDDWVCIGDGAGLGIHPGSTDVVLIGDGAGAQFQPIVAVTPVSDVIAVGDASAKFNQGNDVVAIGHQALSAGVGAYNQGNDNVAIGHFPLVANTTGSKNVALGGYAGSDGYLDGTTFANSNMTGSNNTWIGYDAGPGTTSQLSNTVALGYQAHNDASNQTTIGNSSTNSLKVFGCPAGQTAFNDGSGTCYMPVVGSGLSGMTAGQVPIAATATTVTSSKALAGAGAGITTGPTTSTSGDVTTFSGTAGQIQDSGTLLTALAHLASPTFTGTVTAPTFAGALSGNAATASAVPYSGLTGTIPIWNQNTTGTAANITATSNSTLTTLSALSLPYSQLTGTPATGVSSIFGRTGAVVAASGDYSVSQVTGAAPLASPSFTGNVSINTNGTAALFSTYQAVSTDGNNIYIGSGGQSSAYDGVNSYSGSYNSANGYLALNANTTGSFNTANGYRALYSNTTGNNNTASGFEALYYNTGSNNTANGTVALYSNTTGSSNAANGYAALHFNTTGSSNAANGFEALYSNTTGNNNTANGYQAGAFISGGTVANQTSSNSVYDGYNTEALADGDTNENVFGNTAVGHGSNTTTIGNSSVTDTYLQGIVHGASFHPAAYTVATLPTGQTAGTLVVVSDASSLTAGVCVGGGSNYTIALYTGSVWNCM